MLPLPPTTLLHAPNVHVGGGLVLLEALLRHWPHAGHPLDCVLDRRAKERLEPLLPQPLQAGHVHWTASSFAGRLAAERHLARRTRPNDTMLCFHGLPPLLSPGARTVVFVQNRLLIDGSSLARFAPASRLRLQGERWLCRQRRHQVTAYIVQTASMARLLRDWHGGKPTVHVVPFIDDAPLAAALAAPPPPSKTPEAPWDFVYVADGEAHKNHQTLLQAWELLASEGLHPSMAWTLSPRDGALRQQMEDSVRRHGLRITDLGHQPHAQVLALYRKASALLFASTTESFGLPLLEARRLGLPILAPELDYVRDVCEPAQTFDARSPVSIARAVRRFLGQASAPPPACSPARFLDALKP